MKNIFRIVLAIVLVALGVWLWTVLFPSPEKVIRKRINKVAELMTFNSNEGQIARLANLQQLGGIMARDIEIFVDVQGRQLMALNGRDEVLPAVAAARAQLPGLKVQFLDLGITLSPDKTGATVCLTGQARVPGERDFFVQELKFILRKIEGKWLIIRIETVRTLT
jgi:hypothetical protein